MPRRRRSRRRFISRIFAGFRSLPVIDWKAIRRAIASRLAAGTWAERRAERYLRRRGLRIIERNFRVPSGEIDLIALDGRTLVFVEVKASSAASRARGLDRIHPRKRRRLARAARAYLARRRPAVDRWRFDAIAIAFTRGPLGLRRVLDVRWYQAVFSIEGDGYVP